MKKTIILLLAAAGLAAASTDPLEITWVNDQATLTESLDAISVVFTLDLESLAANGPTDDWGVDTPVFKWNGEAEGKAANGGVTHYLLDFVNYRGVHEYNSQLFFTAPGNTNGFGRTDVPGYTKAIIGYTYAANVSAATAYFTLIDVDGNQTKCDPVSGGKLRESLTVTTLSKNSAVSEIEVYGSLLSSDEIAAAMTNLAGAGSNPSEPEPTPSVPEPTTATLSLLALAGLAARRRRR